MSPVARFAEAVARYRGLMEQPEVDDLHDWLRAVLPVLETLREGVAMLPETPRAAEEEVLFAAFEVSEAEWAALFVRWSDRFIVLLDLPAAHGLEGAELFADDLTSLYREWVSTLRVLESDPERLEAEVAAEWRNGYAEGWGVHLAQALEAFAVLGLR